MRLRLLTILTAAAVAGMPTELKMRQFVADMLRDDRRYEPVLAERVKVKNVPLSLKTVVNDPNNVDPLVTLHKLKNVVSGGGGGRPWDAEAASLYSGNAQETSMGIAGSAYRCRLLKRVVVHVEFTARAADLDPGENGTGVRAALLLAYAVPYALDVLLAFGQPIAELKAVYDAVGLRPVPPAATPSPASPAATPSPASPTATPLPASPTKPAATPSPASPAATPSPVRYTVDAGYAQRLSGQLRALDAAIAETCVQSDTTKYYSDLQSKTAATATAPAAAIAPAAAAAKTTPAAATAINDLPLTDVVDLLEQNANAFVDTYDDALKIRNAGAATWQMAFGTVDLTMDSIGFRRTVRPGYYEQTTAFLKQYWSNTVPAAGGPAASP